jgi:branched-chain amino acid transport system permease protein
MYGRRIAAAVAFAALAVFPFAGATFYTELVTKIMVLAIFALSLDLLVGYTGLVSFGHAAFFGIGAYALGLMAPRSEAASFWLTLPVALIAAGAAAFAVGFFVVRVKGMFFIMVTLAFAQMAYFVVHDTKAGGGSDGIFLYVKPALALGGTTLLDLGQRMTFYYVVLAALAATYAFVAMLLASRFGHALAGIRVNEQRMRAAGFSTTPYKLAAFVIAGALAGLAGFLLAVKDGAVNPELLSWQESGAVLLMLIFGGIGSLRGAVLGAVAFTLLKELFQSEALFGPLAQHWQLTLGLTIIAFVAALPRGLIGIGTQLRVLARERAARAARRST